MNLERDSVDVVKEVEYAAVPDQQNEEYIDNLQDITKPTDNENDEM